MDTAFVKDFIIMNTYFKQRLLGALPTAIVQKPSDNPFAIADDFAPELRARRPQRLMLRTLPSDLPDKLGELDALSGGSDHLATLTPLEKLATVFHFAAAPMRWEPMNNSSTHRSIPSPRFLFTCHTYMLLRRLDTEIADAYLYWPDEHALAWVGQTDRASDWICDRDLAFCIVGDVSRCARPYEDFSLSLVAPEAGLLAAQLAILSTAVGWRTETKVNFEAAGLRDPLALSHWSRFPLAIVDVDLGGDAPPILPDARERIIWDRFCVTEEVDKLQQVPAFLRKAEITDYRERQELTALLAERGNNAAPPPERTLDLDDEWIEHRDLAEAIRHRSSGTLVGGLAPIGGNMDYAMLLGIAKDCSRFDALEYFNELRAARINMAATILNEQRNLAGQFDLDLTRGTITPTGRVDIAVRYRQAFSMMANLREMDLVLTMTVDQAEAVNEFGRRAFFVVQQAVGRWLQFLSLACARRDRFLRPMRSYSEVAVEPFVPIDQQLVFQCLVGQKRRANITYDIG